MGYSPLAFMGHILPIPGNPLEPDMSTLPTHHEDHPDVISRNARIGLVLFAVYFALFLLFLLLNVLTPDTMAKSTLELKDRDISFGGPNLAVVFGIGLIFAAILLSLVYMRLTHLPNGGVSGQTPPA